MAVTGARKGKALAKRFWDLVAFSRVVSWGREFAKVVSYVGRNEVEGRAVLLIAIDAGS